MFLDLPETYAGLELSTQLIISEAMRRGIEVEVLDPDDHFIRLSQNGKTEYIKQASRTSADTYIAPLIMENKAVTKRILKEHQISVPSGIVVGTNEDAAINYERYKNQDIVVKPKSTNFGEGVSILKTPHDQDMYGRAVMESFRYDSSVIIETFIPGREYRFLVIGDGTAAVLYRVPANVKGNGIKTIEQLIKEKNQDPLRGTGYVTPLEMIQFGKLEEQYLKLQGKTFQTIPKDGEVVYLRENSNISTGGDSVDCTDEVHEEYKQIAVRAAQAVGAKICGADLIIPDIKKKPGPSDYSVIELNFNPALHIHMFPYQGEKRRVDSKVLDLLGFK